MQTIEDLDAWIADRRRIRAATAALLPVALESHLAAGGRVVEYAFSGRTIWPRPRETFAPAELASHLANRHGGFGTKLVALPPGVEPIRSVGSLEAVRAEARARGFTHVETMAGPLALAEWQPYGSDGSEAWCGDFVAEDTVADLPLPTAPPFVGGAWRFMRGGSAV